MRNILVDAGPLIALFDAGDDHHKAIRELINDTHSQLISTWPAITETSHMLDFDVRAQLDFLRWIERDGLTVFGIDQNALSRMIELMAKYRDLPMDLADASLVMTAEQLGIQNVISIDHHFDVYRTRNGRHIQNLFFPKQ